MPFEVSDARTGGAGRFLAMDGTGVATFELQQAALKHGYGDTRNAASSMAYGCKGRRSSDLSITRRRTSKRRLTAISHDTDFHQFMLYTPVPGTPSTPDHVGAERLAHGCGLCRRPWAIRINFEHAAISRDDSKRFLDWAFWRDFESGRPVALPQCSKTLLAGWHRYRDWPDARVRERFSREMYRLRVSTVCALGDGAAI